MQIFAKSYLPSNKNQNRVTNAYLASVMAGGEVIGLIHLTSDSELDSGNLARFVWNSIVEEMNYSELAEPLEKLKAATAAGSTKLSDLIRNHHGTQSAEVDLHMMLVYSIQDRVYFSQFGEQKLHILHEKEIVDITGLLKSNKVTAGSSNINAEDVLILSSGNAYDLLSQYIVEPNISNIIASIDSTLEQFENDQGVFLLSSGIDFDKLAEKTLLFGEDTEETKSVDEPLEEAVQEPPVAVEAGESDVEEPAGEVLNIEKNPVKEVGASDSKDKAAAVWTRVTDKVSMPKFDKSEILDRLQKLKGNLPAYWASLTMFLSKMAEGVGSFFGAVFGGISAAITGALAKKYARAPWFKRLQARLTQNRISNFSPKGMKIGGIQERNVRNKRLGIAVMIVVAGIFMILGYQRYQDKREMDAKSEKFNATYLQIEDLLNEADRTVKSDSALTFQKINEIEALLQSPDINIENLAADDAAKLEKVESRIMGVSDQLYKITAVSESVGNIDLSIDGRLDFKDNSRLTDIAIYQNTYLEDILVVSDAGSASVFIVNAASGKITEVDSGGLLKAPAYVEVGVEGIYVFDSTEGVFRGKLSDGGRSVGKLEKLSGVSADSFGGEVNEFAVLTDLDNLYALSKNEKTLYKADRTGSGYGIPYRYLEDSALGLTHDIMADFSVYILSDNDLKVNTYAFNPAIGKLAAQPIALSGLQQPLGVVTAGYTGPSLNQGMYVFDSTSKRIIHLEKPVPAQNLHPNEILFIKQYEYRGNRSDVMSDLKDLVVDTRGVFLYFLDGSRIYKVTL